MNMVTVVETQKGRKGRVKVFLDRGLPFSLSLPVAVEVGLHTGQTLSLPEIERLKSADLLHRSLNSALKYLSSRPRSEAEIRVRLNRRGFAADTIQQVLTRLREQGLADDIAFARFWRENRENFKPLSRRLLGLELRQKGVATETIAEVTAGVEDELGAYRAAQRKARSLAGLDYSSFRKRLGAFLKQRGFDYELINHTVDRVWQEQGNAQPN